MKKLKKINLELNKEVVSNLSNDGLDHVKGGTNQGHESNTGGLSMCNDCPANTNLPGCIIVQSKDTPCAYYTEQYNCTVNETVRLTCGGCVISVNICQVTGNC